MRASARGRSPPEAEVQWGPMNRITRRVPSPVVRGAANPRSRAGYLFAFSLPSAVIALVILLFLLGSATAHGRERKVRNQDYGLGYSSEIEAPESEVLDAVEAVVNNGIIQGSQEYIKDKYIDKAVPAKSSSLFPEWKGPGKVFYKVRTKVLAPSHFKESNDEGTLAVRYVVQSKDASRTIVRIDAVFAEDFRRIVHPSDGSVESAEYLDIQNHVDATELQKKQAADSEKQRQEELAKQAMEQKRELEAAAALTAAEGSSENLEQHVHDLRHQLERIVKAPGADLKSAPFHSASTLRSLEAGGDVVILVVTRYWYGVETENGEHGWVHRSQLEALP